jgi:hypothetical protein
MPGAGITVHEQGVSSWQVVPFDRHRSQNGSCSVRAMSSEHGMAMRMNMGRDAMSC